MDHHVFCHMPLKVSVFWRLILRHNYVTSWLSIRSYPLRDPSFCFTSRLFWDWLIYKITLLDPLIAKTFSTYTFKKEKKEAINRERFWLLLLMGLNSFQHQNSTLLCYHRCHEACNLFIWLNTIFLFAYLFQGHPLSVLNALYMNELKDTLWICSMLDTISP